MESAAPTPGDDTELAGITDLIRGEDSAWEDGTVASFGTLSWTPDLVHRETGALLHIHRADHLRTHVTDRMRAATQAGKTVCLAVSLRHLYDEEMLRNIVEYDPRMFVIDGQRPKPLPRLLACLADEGIQVSTETRSVLGRAGLALCGADGTADERGKRLEALLAFLLSQIEDFVVIERNYRTATEEIDVVVQQRATTGRCWATLGAPFILLEAKNRQERVSQADVSAFRTKMLGRRGSVRIGLMASTSGFTSDAEDQELRFALGDLTIAMLGPDRLDAWIEAEDHDGELESLISRAMLR